MAGITSYLCKPLITSTSSQTALFPSNRQRLRSQKLGQSRRLNAIGASRGTVRSPVVFVDDEGSASASLSKEGTLSLNIQELRQDGESLITLKNSSSLNSQDSTGATGPALASFEAPDSASLSSQDSTGSSAPNSASLNSPDSANLRNENSTDLSAPDSASLTTPDSGRLKTQDSDLGSLRSEDSAVLGAPDSASLNSPDSQSLSSQDSTGSSASNSASLNSPDSANLGSENSTGLSALDSASLNTPDSGSLKTQDSDLGSLRSEDSAVLSAPDSANSNAPHSGNLSIQDSTGLGAPDSGSTNLPEAPTLPGTQPDFGTTSLQETVPDVISGGDDSGPGRLEAVTPESFLDSASKTLSSQKSQALETLTRTTDAVKNSVTELQEKGGSFFNGIKDTVTGSIRNAGDSLKHKYDDINASILKAFQGSSEAQPGGTGIDFSSPFRTGTPINDGLKEVVAVVKNATGTVVVVVGHVLSSAYSSVKALAPPNVQLVLNATEEKVQAVAAPLGSGVEQVSSFLVRIERAAGLDPENPIIPIFIFFGGSIFVGTFYWQSRYGGYSGDISAEKVFELIKNDHNIMLVDIRPQELKQRDGVPDIRRRGRVKLSSVEPIKVDRLRDALRNADQVDVLLTATIIRNLKNVKKHTEVVVMDADGSRSRSIARALRKAGIRQTYRLEGGFKSWAGAKLKTKKEADENPIIIFKEDAEEIADELKPAGVIAALLGTVAFGYAVYEWEKTLELIGAFAVFQAIYKRLDSYESLDDLKADIRTLQKPFRVVFQNAMQLAGQEKPAKLELATSPSTTSVQDRVMQAAAKHGSASGEPDQKTDETEETEQAEVSS